MTNHTLQDTLEDQIHAEGRMAGSLDVANAIRDAIYAVKRYRGDRGLLPGLYEALRVAELEEVAHMQAATLAVITHTTAVIVDMGAPKTITVSA
jgi:hypothetical protein